MVDLDFMDGANESGDASKNASEGESTWIENNLNEATVLPIPAIRLSGVSKKFLIPHEKRKTVAESILGAITKGKVNYEEFYAIKDIDLEIMKGDFLGIIGPNGSGKTTLLKVIAGILQSDSGKIDVKGKIIPLLELGIGFMYDLTAKENAYLYSSILGIPKKKVDEKIDEIMRFAELERFVDTPLKDLSSGMMARLAFSIAKEVDADIYIIDEVLAVGDAKFQKKCMDVFHTLMKNGKTIILVSHDTELVASICSRAILLSMGKIVKEGFSRSVVEYYSDTDCGKGEKADVARENDERLRLANERIACLEEVIDKRLNVENAANDKRMLFNHKNRWGNEDARILSVKTLSEKDGEKCIFRTGDYLRLQIAIELKKDLESPEIGFAIYNEATLLMAGPNTFFSRCSRDLKKGKHIICYSIPSLCILEGKYRINVAISRSPALDWNANYDYWADAARFEVANDDYPEKYGLIAMKGSWQYKGCD
jgi:lipopolysaccharide transport system ATP-binding protein